MEGTIIWETIKAVTIILTIMDSEPFIRIMNRIQLAIRAPRFINNLIDCSFCVTFWLSVIASLTLQTTTPIFISIIVNMIIQKIN